ncbi:MAG: cytochrome c oxidase accessory protein CcoG [Rhizobiales bacterium]|nr:cytochrome c oxidase accessory protein CcoG [Hyphomicrobiales bacterium]
MVTVYNSVERVDAEPVNSKEKRVDYAARVKIFPKRVAGAFRSLKWWIMLITLGIYYVTPWLRWDRGPHAPDQAVLVDLYNGRFYFFFIEIWPQELFYIAGLLIMAGVGLFLITSTVGRAWCGYTCPQTVWVDLFLVVERWVEGDRNARIKLDKGPWTVDKWRKRLLKHAIWIVIAVATGGAWIFYFADAPTLLRNFLTFEAPLIAYTTVAILTATTYVFAGFMREQVCTYMCPWPRIQGAMLDEDSLVVTYNGWRGENRGSQKDRRAEGEEKFGDCIDCNLCVAVCPQGIDIRDGQQLECITCALCIDACDGVMEKIGKPKGLISYATLRTYNANTAGVPSPTTWRSFVRPRTYIYMGVWAMIGLVMLGFLLTRDRLDVNVLHDRNPVYVRLSDGSIRNGYTIKILNMKAEPRTITLSLSGITGATMAVVGQDAVAGNAIEVALKPDKLVALKVYVSASPANLSGERSDIEFKVSDKTDGEQSVYAAKFNGPAGEEK